MDDITWQKMSLNEKIQWRNSHPIMNSWHLVDKIEAKKIARHKAPECKVAKIIHIPKRLEDIDIKKLPKNYLFKANHGSKWIIKVKDGHNTATNELITNDTLIKAAKDWKSRVCSWGREKQYIPIKPQVFFEEFLDNIQEVRCFCFEGKIRLIMIDVENHGKVRSTLYNRDWKRIHAHWRDPEGEDIKRPKNLSKIIRAVEKLAVDIDFVRIDVYLKGNDIYFGEFTFTPNGGSVDIHPHKFDKELGDYWIKDMTKYSRLKIPVGLMRAGKLSASCMNIYMYINVIYRKIRRRIFKMYNDV